MSPKFHFGVPHKSGTLPAIFIAICVSLSGCATHTWAPGPGMSAVDFEPAKARCSLLARHGGSGFVAYGSQSYVAGAAVGHALGETVRTQQDFNDCMLASGWQIADDQTTPAQSLVPVQIKGIADQRKACMSAIRAKPEYEPIRAHFSNLENGQFSMAQLTDDGIPSPSESKLLTVYADEAGVCIAQSLDQSTKVAPPAGPILSAAKSDNEAIMILLVKRQISWGDAAQRQKKAQEDTTAKLRAARL